MTEFKRIIFAKHLKNGERFVLLDDDQQEIIGLSDRIVYTRDKSVPDDDYGLGCKYCSGNASVSPTAKVGTLA